MPAIKAARKVRKELLDAFGDMVDKSMNPAIPIAQRQALLNRAQELRAQWVELEAARFNSDAAAFQKAQDRLSDAVTDLRRATKEIDDIVKIAEKATKVFGLVDKLLKQAAKFIV